MRPPSFRAIAAMIAAASFVLLLARARPIGSQRGIEPLLFAGGLHQPRGIDVAPDGSLLVAEAGVAGASGTVPGRVTRLNSAGQPTVLIDNLPAASPGQPLFAQSGPSALARDPRRNDGSALLFLGPDEAHSAAWVARLIPGEPAWELQPLDLGGDTEVAATIWSARSSAPGAIYATAPLANRLLRLGPLEAVGPLMATTVTGFVDRGQANPLPTGIALGPDGALYVAFFGPPPYRAGSGQIVRVTPDGLWQPVFTSLNFPVALAFSPAGRLYVLELASSFDRRINRFTPGSGRLLALGPSNAHRRVVVRDINYPTALAISPTGDAYFSENGVLSGAGEGRILRVTAPALQSLP